MPVDGMEIVCVSGRIGSGTNDVSLKGEFDMRDLDRHELEAASGGMQALPGTVVTRALMMGSWTPWLYGIGAFAGGFQIGTYIYDNFDTQILDGIDAVVN